jgi:hypothetical protein
MAFSRSQPPGGVPGPPSLQTCVTCVLHVSIAVRHAREAQFVCETWREGHHDASEVLGSEHRDHGRRWCMTGIKKAYSIQ